MATQGLRIVQQILLVPFFLKAWDINIYTDWLLINAAVSFLTIFDGGMQPYFSGLLQERHVQGDIMGYLRAARIAGFNYVILVLSASLITGIVGSSVDWFPFLGLSRMPVGQAYWTLALLSANTLILIPFGVAGSLYRAHDEYDRGVLASLCTLAVQVAVPLILLILDQPSTVLAMGMIACSLIGWTGVSLDQRLRYGPLPWGFSVPTAQELRVMVMQCSYFTAQPITTWLINQGPLLLLGHLATPADTIAYATARTLIGVSRQLTLQLAYPFSFELSLLLIRNQIAAFRRLLENAVSIIGIIGGMLSGVTAVAAAPVIKIWLHGRVGVHPSLVIALTAAVAMTASSQLYQLLLVFSNRPRFIAYGVGAYAIIGLLLSLALAPYFGAVGVAVGLGVGEVIAIVLYLPSRTLRMIGLTSGSLQVSGLVHALLAGALSYGVARAAALVVSPTDYSRLIVFGAIWGVVAGPGAFFLLLNAEQRAVILTKIPRSRRSATSVAEQNDL